MWPHIRKAPAWLLPQKAQGPRWQDETAHLGNKQKIVILFSIKNRGIVNYDAPL